LRGACEIPSKIYRQHTLHTKERTTKELLWRRKTEKKKEPSRLSLVCFQSFFVTATAADFPPRFEREREKRRIENYKEKHHQKSQSKNNKR
jgi:hypothetical protein